MGPVERAPIRGGYGGGNVYVSRKLGPGEGYNVGPFAFVGPDLSELTIGHEGVHVQQPIWRRLAEFIRYAGSPSAPYEREAYDFEQYLRDRMAPLSAKPGSLSVLRRR